MASTSQGPPRHNLCWVHSASQSQAAVVCVIGTHTIAQGGVSRGLWVQPSLDCKLHPTGSGRLLPSPRGNFSSFLQRPPPLPNFLSLSRNVLHPVFHLLIVPPHHLHSTDASVALRELVVSPKMRESFFGGV